MHFISKLAILFILLAACPSYAETESYSDFCCNIGVLRYCRVNTKKYDDFIYKYIKENGSQDNQALICAAERDGCYESMNDIKRMIASTGKGSIKQECNKALSKIQKIMKTMK